MSLDDGELEEEELEVVRFPGLLFKSPPQLLHDVATSLSPTTKMKKMRRMRKHIFEEN